MADVMTVETSDLSVTGLADSLERIASGILKLSGREEIVGTPLENVVEDLYDIFNDEVNNLRGESDNDDDDDDDNEDIVY